MAEATIPQIL